VLESAGAEEHERKEHEVVAGVDDHAGGQRTSAKAGPAEHQADTKEQDERAERVAGLRSVHAGEGKAGEDGSGDHGRHGPLRLSFVVERARRVAGDFLREPVTGRAERWKQEAAEDDLLKERRDGDAEAKEQPGRTRDAKDAVDGGIWRAGHEQAIDDGEHKTQECRADEDEAATSGACPPPRDSVEESPVPEWRKDKQAAGESEEIHDDFAQERVVDIGRRLGCIGDSEEMEVESKGQGGHGGDGAEAQEENENEEVAEVRDARR